jgi:lipopolysaccharide/colanic/teichoic acid biosynthesis glycosyltransferase
MNTGKTTIFWYLPNENSYEVEFNYAHNLDFYIRYFRVEATGFLFNHDEHPQVVVLDGALTQDLEPKIKLKLKESNIPIILHTFKFSTESRKKAIDWKVDDYLFGAVNNSFKNQIERIREYKSQSANTNAPSPAFINPDELPVFRFWRYKRSFDFTIALLAILALSPIFILAALIIRLESKGPIIYKSKRAGSGYKIFDFYKFRSMRQDADKMLKELAKQNQYTNSSEAVFYKFKNDPRVTRFGRFIRKTSIDELPQLFNVLKGDMSLIGNRPLPLYEAEKLTQDQMAWRFIAPAGLTGLWQITKRGKDNMTPEERIQLDIEYAMKNSFWLDVKVLCLTLPAIIQKERV